MLLAINDDTNETREKAKMLLHMANDIANYVQSQYEHGYTMLWDAAGWDTAKAQECLDYMEAVSPGSTIALFQYHDALGTLVAAIGGKKHAAPMGYAVVDGKIVLNADEEYPRAKKERLRREAQEVLNSI